jgi:hypothetical protein
MPKTSRRNASEIGNPVAANNLIITQAPERKDRLFRRASYLGL